MMQPKLALKILMGAIWCFSGSLFAAANVSEEKVLPVAAEPSVSGVAQRRAIKHNPFQRPDFTRRSNRAAIEEQKAAPQQILQLRAVLYSQHAPLVNINGKILAVGEEIEGFLLHEVSEDGAVLVKDEVQIMLSMAQE